MENKAWVGESPQISLPLLEDFVVLTHQIYIPEDAISLLAEMGARIVSLSKLIHKGTLWSQGQGWLNDAQFTLLSSHFIFPAAITPQEQSNS